MKKRGYIILIAILLLGIILGVISYGVERYNDNKLEKNVIEKYGFEISYPKAYKDINKSGDNMSELLTNLTVTASGEQISEYMQNLNLVETIRNLKNDKNGIKLIVEAINTEKTSLSIEEICNRYIVMFKVYNEGKKIIEKNTEVININDNEAGKVTIKVVGKSENSLVITYLLSLKDKEITVTFIAPEKVAIKYEKEINRIINSLKVY